MNFSIEDISEDTIKRELIKVLSAKNPALKFKSFQKYYTLEKLEALNCINFPLKENQNYFKGVGQFLVDKGMCSSEHFSGMFNIRITESSFSIEIDDNFSFIEEIRL